MVARVYAVGHAAGPAGCAGYNRPVSRFYAPDDADALVPELAPVVTRLRDERAELVELRDAFRSREGDLVEDLIADEPVPDGDDPELRVIRLRMRGIVDQMQADVAWLDERNIVLRDIATGLLDFPALVSGRQVWLCWRLGEDHVELVARDRGRLRRAQAARGAVRRCRPRLTPWPTRPAGRPRPARAEPGPIRQGDRDKALRPLTLEARRAAFEAGVAAYGRGDFFEAHEDLEPAWMGTDDLAERALHQGLIKVAAAYVHAVRGNPRGHRPQPRGRPRATSPAPARPGRAWGVDVAALLARRRRAARRPGTRGADPPRHPEDPRPHEPPDPIPRSTRSTPTPAGATRSVPRSSSTCASPTSSPTSGSRARCSSRCRS